MIKLEDYNILKKIGSGGMGDVYLAEHKVLDTKVAIKSLHANLVNDEVFRTRFRTEAKIHSKLDHPNIVKLLDYRERKDGLFLIMEYVDGKQLDEHIKKVTGPIPEKDLTTLFEQILDAIGYAHEEGFVHRDIKPSNIMIDKKGKIKVLDFGIAKMQEEEKGLTKTGIQIGTVAYMSPEQVDAKKVDKLSDIYSLGVTLFYMAVGKSPYDGETNTFSIQTKIVSDPFPEASKVYPGVSERFEEIIKKATQKNKKDRYQSCKDFKIDFDSTKKIKKVINKANAKKSLSFRVGYNFQKVKKRGLLIIASLAILFLGYTIITAYPSLIYNYDELDIKIDNQETVFDLSSNDFGKAYFQINKPYNSAELVVSIEGKQTNTLYDNSGNGFGTIDLFKDLSKRTKDNIASKLVSGDKIDMSIAFTVMGGISNDEILAKHTQSYSFIPNTDASSNLPQIIEVNGTNFTKQYSAINKEDLISKILDDDFVKTSNLKETKIIRNNSTVKISVKVDKIYESSYIVYHYNREKNSDDILKHSSADTEQLEQKTTVKKNTDGSYTLSREISVDDNITKYSYLVLHNYDSEGIDHMVLLGSFIVDTKAPRVSTYLSWNCDTDDDISGCVYVERQSWRGNRKPFKVRVKGDISKIYINGYRISFDKAKASREMIDLYKVLDFPTPLGHYRWPIKVYDLRGNVSESYTEGECVPAEDL
jgi:serine/threonine protein kinase